MKRTTEITPHKPVRQRGVGGVTHPVHRILRVLVWLSLGLAPTCPIRGEISEPDNILYGTIVIGTNPVTATRSDVVVEARRAPGDPAIASYRMGTSAGLGNFYSLRLPVEALGPVTDTNASVPGTTLYIVVRDAAGVQGQGTYTIPERGAVQRVDFGVAVPDSDGNGLPDAWEIARFGGIGQEPDSDSDGDGQSNLMEWIAGSDPLDPQDAFSLSILPAGSQIEVSFVALRAEGPGYDGVTRHYALESSTNLVATSWLAVPGFTNLPGNNQILVYPAPLNAVPPHFYRGRVWLE